jgi:ubiquinol-cytochrome c reductase cytochrome c subunit
MTAFVFSATLALAVAPAAPVDGRLAYETRCAACHGEDLRGGDSAPSLRGAGAADLDFWMVTGRMPAAVPWVEVGHRGRQIPLAEIAAIERYVTSVAPGGPPIPQVATGGDAGRGRALFVQNCEHCHGIGAEGAAIGDRDWAPTLHLASVTQVAEAIRVGPGNMPKFGPRQLDDAALGDVVTYVNSLDVGDGITQIPLGTSGAVPEGLIGWLTVGVLAFLAYAFSKRTPSRRPTSQSASENAT